MTPVVQVWIAGIVPMLVLAVIAWVICSIKRNVGLIDIFWSLFLLGAGIAYAVTIKELNVRSWLLLALLAAWALRLAIHLAIRNWSAVEDHRYQEIRARNQPGFVWKSFFYIFLLQAILAWLVSSSLASGMVNSVANVSFVTTGALIACAAFVFESIADWQLSQFKRDSANRGQVLQSGLWKYSRHPNYFGECCFWWGVFILSFNVETWWTLISPVLMTVLLMRVSGVTLLEKTIVERRPAYREYIARTNAFFPGPPRGLKS